MKSSQLFEPITQFQAPQLQSHIKKKPLTQLIKGVEYTYSILSKKQTTFILTHDRFLILKGIESISYARNLPEKTQLPFKQQSEIPKAKFTYAISSIEACTTENDILRIQFNFDKNSFWEFICPTKSCAQEWRGKIQSSLLRFKEFNNSKYEKYEDYLRQKEKKINIEPPKAMLSSKTIPIAQQKQQKSPEKQNELIRNESFDFQALNSPNQERTLTKSKSELSTNSAEMVLVKVPDNSQEEIINRTKEIDMNMSKKKPQFPFEGLGNGSMSPLQESKLGKLGQTFEKKDERNNHHFSFMPEQNIKISPIKDSPLTFNYESTKSQNVSPTPITHLSESPHINHNILPQELTKLESLFLQKSFSESPSQNFLNKSFSNISVTGRQEIRSQIMSYKREWIDELISRQEQSQLMIDFKKYSRKVIEVLVNELHVTNDKRIFPQKEWTNEFASYIVDDVYVEIYFFTEEQVEKKHTKYQKAVKQFKNFDYFLEATQNENIIYPPLMTIFQYKGFVGMVKTIICDERQPFKNRQFYNELDRNEFELQSRINSQILLNQAKCKIICYKKSNFLSKLVTEYENIYFLDKLETFLPEERQESIANQLLRPELVQDQELEENVFGQNGKGISEFEIQGILDKKIIAFVESIQNQEEYFTNSQELAELIHSFGLNIRHLGIIYKRITQQWLKLQIKAELAARSLKTLFRFDLQSCILNQIERMNTKQRQSERQAKRVISFLNAVVGNGDGTFRVWRGLNNYSSKHYGSPIWTEEFNDINIGFFLQAIQYHLKIVLSEDIHNKTYFQSMKTLEQRDFIKFQSDITMYNLDYTENYEEINQCLEQITNQNFQQLCTLMVKQTRSKKNYIDLLKGQPLHEKINEYLLNFITPEDNIEFYNKLQTGHRPNRFVYQSKIAQIKWYLRVNRPEGVTRLVKFIEDNVRKWLGQYHPILVQLNRALAQYYSEHKGSYMKAVAFGTTSLQIQLALFGGDSEPIWKDYFLLAKIHFGHENYQQALQPFIKAKKLVIIENLSSFEHFSELLIGLSKCYRSLKMFKESYLNIRELYNVLKEQGSSFLLEYLLEAVLMIKDLLQRNQQYESYYRFIQTDFSHVLVFFVDNHELLKQTIKMIFLPYLKSIIFQKSKNRMKILSILEQISKLTQSTFSCTAYLQEKIREKKFPYIYLQYLKDIDGITDEIYSNELVQKWISFHRMSNDTILQKIGGIQINRGFEFLADVSAILGILGNESFGQLSIMQK